MSQLNCYIFLLYFPSLIFFIGHQPTPFEAGKELIENWPYEDKPHVVMDAAFGSLKMASVCSEKGFLFSLSTNSGVQEKWLWDCLKSGLCYREGRVHRNENGVIASVYYDNKAHCILTNAWKQPNGGRLSSGEDEDKESGDEEEEISEEVDNNEEGGESMSEDEVSDVRKKKKMRQDEYEGAEWVVTRILERKEKSTGTTYKTMWSTEEETWENFSSFVDVGVVSQHFLQFATENDWMTGFRPWSLQKLREMCVSLGYSKCMFFFSQFFFFFFF